ncbi:MAG: peptidylprolyl isomerase [Planctomycetota bacterium]|jgi:parvulin-like peptidyl-prolyl isomerase
MTLRSKIIMMARTALSLLILATLAAAEGEIAADLVAEHPEGKWKIRKREFYIHLARYNSAHANARVALEPYLKERIVLREAGQRNISITNKEIDAFLADLDRQVREKSKGAMTLEDLMKSKDMTRDELRRTARVSRLRERVARSIIRERDKTWPRHKEASEDLVTVTIDELWKEEPKEFDLAKLKKGVLAKVGDIEINEYDYGRQLVRVLPITELTRALQDLVLAEQVVILTGTRAEPTAEEMESERRAFLIRERNRIARLSGEKDLNKITVATIEQVLGQRGLSIEKVLANPGFKAQARARGFFRRQVSDEDMTKFYKDNAAKYGDRLRVRRILVLARAQPVMIAGKKVRTLDQGRAAAQAIHLRLKGGEDFGKIAMQGSDDPDVIRKNGGFVPLWLTADAPSYEDTWAQANRLKEGEISAPFFSAGRGFVIVKLINRRRALGFSAQKALIRRDAAEYDYRLWQGKAMRDIKRGIVR